MFAGKFYFSRNRTNILMYNHGGIYDGCNIYNSIFMVLLLDLVHFGYPYMTKVAAIDLLICAGSA